LLDIRDAAWIMRRMGWIVTEGSYSDYSVLCVCPDEATANAIVDAIGPDESNYYGPRVEEVALRTGPPTVKEVLHLNWATDGEGNEYPYPYQPYEHTTKEFWWEEALPACKVNVYVDNSLTVVLHLSGWDHERVRKVFSETKARIKANFDVLIAGGPREIHP
jgi:hypothetical protein